MSKINILDKNVAQLIAAGEVVERPASVIKELVENSVDAGATKITVEIERGGISYIRVTDNGQGIEKSEIKKAFLSHATSKVSTSQDLESITTMGFRGEALASICAVSKVTVITSTEDAKLGTVYIIEGGEEQTIDETGCAKGTTITVENLFFNTPARLKFLKKDVTEGNAVASIVEKLALSHPSISFSFIRDSKEIFNTPGNSDIKSTVYAVYGKSFANGILDLKYMLNGIELTGCITKPYCAKNNRSMQNFFVNSRLVSSKTMTVALEQAYKGSIMKGKFPACVMYLEVSPRVIDINVHPAKTEIRFSNEKNVFDAIYYAVKSSLMKDDGIAKLSLNPSDENNSIQEEKNIEDTPAENTSTLEYYPSIPSNNISTKPSPKAEIEEDPILTIPKKSDNKISSEINNNDMFVKFDSQLHKSIHKELTESEQKTNDEIENQSDNQVSIAHTDEKQYKSEQSVVHELSDTSRECGLLIGEVFKTYIILQRQDDILLVDKHAAHERILYEKLKSRNNDNYSQMLLFPINISTTKNEHICVLENIDVFEKVGFDVDDFGNVSVILRAIPSEFDISDAENIFRGALECLMKGIDSSCNEGINAIYHTMACRAAVKAGDISMDAELLKLISELEENNEIKYCPHGRPIVISITKKDIDKKFGRI